MSLQKILSLSLFSWLKGSTEASLAQSRELTSAHLFHLQGLSWTTSRCPSSSSSSFVVPLYGSSVILLPAFSHVFIPHAQSKSDNFSRFVRKLAKKIEQFHAIYAFIYSIKTKIRSCKVRNDNKTPTCRLVFREFYFLCAQFSYMKIFHVARFKSLERRFHRKFYI